MRTAALVMCLLLVGTGFVETEVSIHIGSVLVLAFPTAWWLWKMSMSGMMVL